MCVSTIISETVLCSHKVLVTFLIVMKCLTSSIRQGLFWLAFEAGCSPSCRRQGSGSGMWLCVTSQEAAVNGGAAFPLLLSVHSRPQTGASHIPDRAPASVYLPNAAWAPFCTFSTSISLLLSFRWTFMSPVSWAHGHVFLSFLGIAVAVLTPYLSSLTLYCRVLRPLLLSLTP